MNYATNYLEQLKQADGRHGCFFAIMGDIAARELAAQKAVSERAKQAVELENLTPTRE